RVWQRPQGLDNTANDVDQLCAVVAQHASSPPTDPATPNGGRRNRAFACGGAHKTPPCGLCGVEAGGRPVLPFVRPTGGKEASSCPATCSTRDRRRSSPGSSASVCSCPSRGSARCP